MSKFDKEGVKPPSSISTKVRRIYSYYRNYILFIKTFVTSHTSLSTSSLFPFPISLASVTASEIRIRNCGRPCLHDALLALPRNFRGAVGRPARVDLGLPVNHVGTVLAEVVVYLPERLLEAVYARVLPVLRRRAPKGPHSIAHAAAAVRAGGLVTRVL